MYEHCIYCSGKLGRNEALEGFLVGRSVAFDAERGRLWAICPKCARWNLAPLEERWEVVEDAERRFRDTRIRAHSENVGMARLADGTRLIRIGAALPAEFAAWRYGGELVRRWRANRWVAAAGTVGTIVKFAGLMSGTGALFAGAGVVLLADWRRTWLNTESVLGVVPRPGFPDFTFHMAHLPEAVLWPARDGNGVELRVRDEWVLRSWARRNRHATGLEVVLDDAATRRVLRRGMVYVNRMGAPDPSVSGAVRLLAERGGSEAFLHESARAHRKLSSLGADPKSHTMQTALALEMAVHEDEERRILAGELTLLTSAWREAEQIARIADSLADPDADPPS